mmetsp:Transcript_23997/g.66501  ORF Transcript_23997/g.66501 Transcript_23997/m.66501 type:complete len:247 (+) Transcript_23997:273-1013(+)
MESERSGGSIPAASGRSALCVAGPARDSFRPRSSRLFRRHGSKPADSHRCNVSPRNGRVLAQQRGTRRSRVQAVAGGRKQPRTKDFVERGCGKNIAERKGKRSVGRDESERSGERGNLWAKSRIGHDRLSHPAPAVVSRRGHDAHLSGVLLLQRRGGTQDHKQNHNQKHNTARGFGLSKNRPGPAVLGQALGARSRAGERPDVPEPPGVFFTAVRHTDRLGREGTAGFVGKPLHRWGSLYAAWQYR